MKATSCRNGGNAVDRALRGGELSCAAFSLSIVLCCRCFVTDTPGPKTPARPQSADQKFAQPHIDESNPQRLCLNGS